MPLFVDAVGLATGLQREEARQPLRRQVGGDAGGVDAQPGRGNGAGIHVGGKHLHGIALLEGLHALDQQNGQRIGFFAGRATGRPDAHGSAIGLAEEELGNDLLFQNLGSLGVAKKAGDANQQVAKQRIDLGGRLLQVADVGLNGFQLVHGDAPLDAPVNGAGFVLRKVVPGLGAQQHKDLPQGILGPGTGGLIGACNLAEDVGGIGHQLRGHLGRWQLVVNQAGPCRQRP